MAADRVGAAKRRLGQFLRHERLSVTMALAAAQHHSAPKSAGPVTYDALRGQNTAKAGRWRGVLKDPEPQGGTVTVGYVAAPGPLLKVSSMAGGDSVDGTAFRFLVKKVLERQKEQEEEKAKDEKRRRVLEEEEERMLELNRRVSADLPLTWAETEAWRRWILLPPRSRKRKKRRKRRTPRTSSRSLRGRARRRQRQWYFYGYAGYVHFTLCSFVRDKAAWLLDGMDQNDRSLVFVAGCGICSAGSTVLHLALCSFLYSSGL